MDGFRYSAWIGACMAPVIWAGELLYRCLPVAVFLLVFLLSCEATCRFGEYFFPQVLREDVVRDTALGWRTQPDYRFSGELRDASDRLHHVEIAIDANGFREFGTRKGALRILCVGDSYTFAKDVSQEETYYSVAGELAPADVFACGTPGHSSLQEFLVLDRWLDKVDPDAVVWQFCWNDFIGNDLRLARSSTKNKCRTLQPFLSPEESVFYATPGGGLLRNCRLPAASAFLRDLAVWTDDRTEPVRAEDTIETRIERGDPKALELLHESLHTTDRIMAMVRARCGDRPIIAFDVNGTPPYHETFQQICGRHQITFLENVAVRIWKASTNGETVCAGDGAHWSAAAHRICGEALAGMLSEMGKEPQGG